MQIKGRRESDNEYYDLGNYARTITTSIEEAQIWFSRGLIWTYGFNHEAAIDCFERAIIYDENCAMAYWGLAYALGPNYNKPWEIYDKVDLEKTLKRTHDAAATAKRLAANAGSQIEKALADAIQLRYLKDSAVEDPARWGKLYADAMKGVYHQYGDDLDVIAFYADSLMNLTPWKLWDIHTGKPNPEAKTLEVQEVLEKALQRDDALKHPGILHLYIHFIEMSPHPEKGLPYGDRLRGLVPDSGHLEHMPTHLDVLCGDWRRAVSSNSDAIRADNKYLKIKGAVNYYTLYRCHDYHFKLYGAMFAGQSKIAIQTAEELAATIPEELLRVESPPMADWLEGFVAIKVHAYVRFGKWDEIIAMTFPEDQDLYCFTTAMMWYAKGVAYSNTKDIGKAEVARKNFNKARSNVKKSRALFNNTASAVLRVASFMLEGEFLYRRGNLKVGIEQLRNAVKMDDSLLYDEPWGWMTPTRHALGALLMEENRFNEAVKVYEADLGLDKILPRQLQHPNNVWALHGYHECLKRLGREEERLIIAPQLRVALAAADIEIRASCFCRRNS